MKPHFTTDDVTPIDVGIESIDKIFHIADVHIRNLKRHEEYREVFERLYNHMRNSKTDDSIAVIAGDLVHSKTEMSPEVIEMSSDFLRAVANIVPTILIPGNHDFNANNPSRLDALSPIVDNLNHPNLFYLRDTGLWSIGDTCFSHFSILSSPDSYIAANHIPDDFKTKVAMYHGVVDRAKTDHDYMLTNSKVDVNTFYAYDIGILGDIHRRQSMDLFDHVKYSGSLIQQNFGEDLGHGILEWDVASREATYVEIPNDWGYYTMYVKEGVVPLLPDVPKKVRLRLRIADTDPVESKKVVADIRRIYDVRQLTVSRVDKVGEDLNTTSKSLNVGDVKNVQYQNELIADYVNRKFVVDDDVISGIRKVNEKINTELDEDDLSSNRTWKPLKFEWSNMFSYGEGNEVDFQNMKGLIGLFSPNATGKSSFLDAICFCLFDKSTRAYKATDIINNDKTKFSCKLTFKMEGKIYVIEREGEIQTSGRLPVDVNFYMVEKTDDGEIVKTSLNGEQRRDTNAIIRQYVGEYEDFILTTMSVQNDNTLFIDKSQTERKDILAQFIGIDVFDHLYNIANEESRDIQTVMKSLESDNFSKQLVKLESEEADLKLILANSESILTNLKNEISERNDALIDLNKSLSDVPSDVTNTNRTTLEKKLKDATERLLKERDNLEARRIKKREHQQPITFYEELLKEMDANEIEANYKQHQQWEKDIQKLSREIQTIETKLEHINHSIDRVEGYDFDPDCEYCVQRNESDAKNLSEWKDNKRDLTERFGSASKRRSTLEDKVSNSDAIELHERRAKALRKIDEFERKIHQHELAISKHETKVARYESEVDKCEHTLETYDRMKSTIEHNAEINEHIKKVRAELRDLQNEADAVNKKIKNIHGKLQVNRNKQQTCETGIKKYKEKAIEFKVYKYYLEAVKRDGVPYELITQSIPRIEREVNNILAQMVDFGLMLNMDGKNINASITYNNKNAWPLELASGMEKFISSLAIRVALINISSLPRPNFLAVDEGFGNLDSENFNSLYMLFDYMKSAFGFVIVISHLEIMRDTVDKLLEIRTENGFSTLKNTDR